MSKLSRVFQKLFGGSGSSGNFGVFGSLAASSPTTTKNITSIQALPAWDNGWQDEVVGDFVPALEDMNSLCYVTFYQLCYLLQQGIPEYDASTTYYIGSYINIDGQLYISKVNDNVGNSPSTSPSQWDTCINLVNGGIPTGAGAPWYSNAAAPAGFLLCDGSAVSRATYAALFVVLGTTWGAGNGTTTFNLPDSRTRVLAGYSSGDSVFGTFAATPGVKTVNLAHNHGGNTGNVVQGAPQSSPPNTGVNIGDQERIQTAPISSDLSATQSIVQPSLVCNQIIKY